MWIFKYISLLKSNEYVKQFFCVHLSKKKILHETIWRFNFQLMGMKLVFFQITSLILFRVADFYDGN